MRLPLRFAASFGVMVLLVIFCAPAYASDVMQQAIPPPIIDSWEMTWPAGVLMLVLLFSAFFAMTKYEVPLPLAMSLVSLAFLVIQWENAPHILRIGFEHYAPITVLFTAVAVPAHMIERSQGFKWVAAWLGHQLGKIRLRRPRLTTPLLVGILLIATYVTAGLMHNVTSILIMTPVIIRLCASYQVPSRWILSAALIASNLGGFSTRWGDTPNIIESATWGLGAGDFMREVLPGVSYFVAVEANPSSPGHHIHATWAGCGSLRRKVIWKRWFGLYGRNLIEPIRGKRDALNYVCKSLSYAAKDPIWWDEDP